MTKMIFKKEDKSTKYYENTYGVFFEGENERFDTIVLPWGERKIRYKQFGGGYTQLNEGVGEIINGKAGFLRLNEIKKAYRNHVDKIRQLQSRMLKIEIKREPAPKGQLMNDRELTKILAMINSKVKNDIIITYADIEEQFLKTGKMYYELCPSLTNKETMPIFYCW